MRCAVNAYSPGGNGVHMGIKSERGGKAVAAVGLQYFIYFGVLGAFLPYFNLYCFHLGFSGFQIGLLSGFRSVTLVVFALAWAALADRFQNRKAIYLYCSLAAAAAWTLFLASEDFSFLVMATLVYGIFFAPLISFLEAFALDSLDRDKRRYGRLRAWGSISFIATVLILGWVIDLVGSRIILGVILAGSLVQAAGAVALPAMGPKTGKKTPIDRRFLARPRTVVFLACGLLMLASHGTYYGFFSIHLEALGVGKTLIGTAWALASMAEILVMVGSERLFRKFSPGVGPHRLLCRCRPSMADPGPVHPSAGHLFKPGPPCRHLRHLSHGQHPLHGPAHPPGGKDHGSGGQQRRPVWFGNDGRIPSKRLAI